MENIHIVVWVVVVAVVLLTAYFSATLNTRGRINKEKSKAED